MEEEKLEWWGYMHESGNIIVKRYFSQQDIVEALDSPFVKYISGVVYAKDRKEAVKLITEELS